MLYYMLQQSRIIYFSSLKSKLPEESEVLCSKIVVSMGIAWPET